MKTSNPARVRALYVALAIVMPCMLLLGYEHAAALAGRCLGLD